MATINTNLAGVTSGTQYASAGNNTIYTNLPFNTNNTTNTNVTFIVGANASVDILYNQNFRVDSTVGFHELFGNIEVQGVSSDYTVSSWYGKVQLIHKTSGQVISFQLTKPQNAASNSGVNVEFLDGAIAFTSNVNGQGVWSVWATQGGTGTSTWGAGGLASQVPGTFSPGALPLDLAAASGAGYINYSVNSSDITNWTGGASGATYVLTTGIDNLTGTIYDDTFNAALSGGFNTLNTLDQLNGNGGTDTLNAIIDSSVTPLSLQNIEIINLTNANGTARSVGLVNAGQALEVTNSGSTGALTVTGLAATATQLNVYDTDAASTFEYISTAGTQTVGLAVDNVGVGGAATVTLAGIETINLQSGDGTSQANAINLNAAAATTVNISGSSDLTLTGATAATNINASTFTGDLVAGIQNIGSLTGGTGDDTLTLGAAVKASIAGGAGDDTIDADGFASVVSVNGGADDDTLLFGANLVANTATAANNDSVDGGTGFDTLSATSAAFNGVDNTVVSAQQSISNIEAIEVTNALGHDLTLSKIQAGIEMVNLDGGTDATARTITFDSGIEGAVNLGNVLNNSLTVASAGTGTADLLIVANDTASTNVFNGKTLVTTGVENLVVDGTTTSTVDQSFDSITGGTTTDIFFVGNNTINVGGTIAGDLIDADILSDNAVLIMGQAAGANVTTILGSENNRTLGNGDVLQGRATAATTILAGGGNDIVVGGTAADSLDGGTGNDTITGGDGNDVVKAGEGDDQVTVTQAAIVSVDGGAGNDSINLGNNLASSDSIDGGAGTNTLSLDGTYVDAAFTNVSNIQAITLDGADNVTLGAEADAAGILSVTGSGADDTVILQNTFNNDFTYIIGAGEDNLDASNSNAAITISADAGNLTGLDDLLAGSNVNNILSLRADNGTANLAGTRNFSQVTVRVGATATDDISIDVGSDLAVTNGTTLVVDGTALTNSGATMIFDASDLTTATKNVSVTSGAGADTVYGGAGNDTYNGGAGNDSMLGGGGNDVIAGGTGNNNLYGGDGADSITAAGGNDYLGGDAGNDTLTGGNGNDQFFGGAGTDSITAGSGNDVFVYSEQSQSAQGNSATFTGDTINGFSVGDGTLAGVVDVIKVPVNVTSTSALTLATASLANFATELSTNTLVSNALNGAGKALALTVTSGTAAGTYLLVQTTGAGYSAGNTIAISLANPTNLINLSTNNFQNIVQTEVPVNTAVTNLSTNPNFYAGQTIDVTGSAADWQGQSAANLTLLVGSAGIVELSPATVATFTAAQFTAMGNGVSKFSADQNVNATGATTLQQATLSTQIASIASMTNLTLVAVDVGDTVTANLLSVATGATVNALGATPAEITSIVTNAAHIGAGLLTNATMSAAQFASADVTTALAAGAATLGAVTTDQATVVASAAKIANNGVTSITLTNAAQFVTAMTNNAGAFANNGVSLTAQTVAAGAETTAVVNNVSKLAAGQVSSITLADAATFTTVMTANAAAFDAGSVSLTAQTVAAGAETTAVVNNVAKLAAGQVSSITLADAATFNTVMTANAAAFDAGSVSLTAQTVAAGAETTAVVNNVAKLAAGQVSSITLADAATFNTVMTANAAAFDAGSVSLTAQTVAAGAETTAVVNNVAKLAAGQVSSITLADAATFNTVMTANAAAFDAGSVSLTAQTVAAGAETTAVVNNVAKLAAGQVSSITLADAATFNTVMTANAAAFDAGSVSLTAQTVAAGAETTAVVNNVAKLAAGQVSSITLADAATFNTVMTANAAAFDAGSVSLTAQTVAAGAETTAVVNNVAKLAAGQVSSITLADAATFNTVMTANGAAFDAGSVSLTAQTVAAGAETTAVVNNVAKLAAGQVSSITLADAATFTTVMATAATAAVFDAGSVSLQTGNFTTPEQTGAFLSNFATLADNQVTAVGLTDSQFETVGLLAKLATGAATVDATGATLAQQQYISDNISKVAASGAGAGITNLTLVAGSLDDTVFTNLLGKAATTNAVVNAAGASAAETTSIVSNAGNIAAGQLTNATLTATQFLDASVLLALNAAGSGATVSATGVSAANLNSIGSNSTKMATNGLTGTMVLTGGATITSGNIANLFGIYSGGVAEVVATGMSNAAAGQLDQVAANIGEIAANGITGTMALGINQSDTEMTALFSKYSGTSVTVAADATMTTAQENVILSNLGVIQTNGITGAAATFALSLDQFNSVTAAALNPKLATGVLEVTGGAGGELFDFTGYTKEAYATGDGGNDTFKTGAGVVNVTDLNSGDVIQTVVGGTVVATNISAFVATAATANNGSASLTALAGGSTIDVSLATGGNGFTINGGNGVDNLTGSGNDDTILAGNGATNTLTGFEGADTLTGGTGADTFVYAEDATGDTVATADTINGFTQANDFIKTGIAGLVAGDVAIADGAGLADFAAFVAAVDAAWGAGDKVYAAYDVANISVGNGLVAIDNDGSGDFSAGDSLIVLTGVNLVAEISTANFIA